MGKVKAGAGAFNQLLPHASPQWEQWILLSKLYRNESYSDGPGEASLRRIGKKKKEVQSETNFLEHMLPTLPLKAETSESEDESSMLSKGHNPRT